MTTLLRRELSRLTGWVADRRIPGPLRRPVYGAYCRFTGADASEAALAPHHYPSLGAFFVRRLRDGVRTVAGDVEVLASPCDGRFQAVGEIKAGRTLQAKGSSYEIEELLAGAADTAQLEGGTAWTIYLSPRDYHRVHAPEQARLTEVRWLPGDRRSVAPGVLARRERVLSTNERAVLRLEGAHGPLFLVMVGALNVGRIRVVGVEQGASPAKPVPFERGAELARFEMGSTVVLLAPPGHAHALPSAQVGEAISLGDPIGRFGAAARSEA